jgi:hypothetical protein
MTLNEKNGLNSAGSGVQDSRDKAAKDEAKKSAKGEDKKATNKEGTGVYTACIFWENHN